MSSQHKFLTKGLLFCFLLSILLIVGGCGTSQPLSIQEMQVDSAILQPTETPTSAEPIEKTVIPSEAPSEATTLVPTPSEATVHTVIEEDTEGVVPEEAAPAPSPMQDASAEAALNDEAEGNTDPVWEKLSSAPKSCTVSDAAMNAFYAWLSANPSVTEQAMDYSWSFSISKITSPIYEEFIFLEMDGSTLAGPGGYYGVDLYYQPGTGKVMTSEELIAYHDSLTAREEPAVVESEPPEESISPEAASAE